jgi:uncharacterized membrane protein HdeD (DUF308 family)
MSRLPVAETRLGRLIPAGGRALYPGLSLTILAVTLGIGLTVSGLVEITLALHLRRLTKVKGHISQL